MLALKYYTSWIAHLVTLHSGLKTVSRDALLYSYLLPREVSLTCIWNFSIVIKYTNTTFQKQTAIVFRLVLLICLLLAHILIYWKKNYFAACSNPVILIFL
jgi:hypothetical protein